MPRHQAYATFDQRFLIWQTMDNITKVSGNHVFKAGFYFQSASNASNSQNHVEDVRSELRRRLLKALHIEECRGQRLVSRKEMLQNLHG